eukprot:5200491-Heterocapsa_arctica.AAC.1
MSFGVFGASKLSGRAPRCHHRMRNNTLSKTSPTDHSKRKQSTNTHTQCKLNIDNHLTSVALNIRH